jgi:hypothetical protein
VPTLRGAASAIVNTAGASATVTNPSWNGSSTPAGDIVLIWCVKGNNPYSWSCPGFTAETLSDTNVFSLQLLHLITTGSEGATFTVSITPSGASSGGWGMAALSYYNESQGGALDPGTPGSGTILGSQSVTVTAPGYTAAYGGEQLVWLGADTWPAAGTVPALSPPAGFTPQIGTQSTALGSGHNVSFMAADMAGGGSGPTGSQAGSSSVSYNNAALLVGIVPEGTGPSGAYFTDQAGPRPRWAPELRRGRQFSPVLPQANRGKHFPLFTRQPGWRPRLAPQLRRGRFFSAGRGQSSQGVQFPLFTRQPGPALHFAAKLRRGAVRAPVRGPWSVTLDATSASAGYFTVTAASASMISPGDWFQLRTSGGALTEPTIFTVVTVGAPSGGNVQVFFTPPAAVDPVSGDTATQETATRPAAQFPLSVRQGASRGRLVVPRRRPRFFFRAMPQGERGVHFPLFTRQPGSRPRWLPPARLLRARYLSAPPPQASQGVHFPLLTRQARHSIKLGRPGGRFALLPRGLSSNTVTVAMQATGTLAAAGTRVIPAAVALRAAGSLSVAGGRIVGPQVAMTAAGHLAATGVRVMSPTVTMAAAGSLAARGTVLREGAVAMTAAGSLAVAAPSFTHAVAMQATGSLGALAVRSGALAVVMQASGSLAAAASSGPPAREIIISRRESGASWGEITAEGTWDQPAPLQGPDVVKVQGLDDGLYDDDEPGG